MSFYFADVTETPEEGRVCVGCRADGVRAKRVIVSATLRRDGARFALPVAYCAAHLPNMGTPADPQGLGDGR